MPLGLRAASSAPQMSDPATGAVAFATATDVTPPANGRAIYVSTAGNLQVVMQDGQNVTFTGLLAGQIYAIAIKSIVGAGSTAVGLILL